MSAKRRRVSVSTSFRIQVADRSLDAGQPIYGFADFRLGRSQLGLVIHRRLAEQCPPPRQWTAKIQIRRQAWVAPHGLAGQFVQVVDLAERRRHADQQPLDEFLGRLLAMISRRVPRRRISIHAKPSDPQILRGDREPASRLLPLGRSVGVTPAHRRRHPRSWRCAQATRRCVRAHGKPTRDRARYRWRDDRLCAPRTRLARTEAPAMRRRRGQPTGVEITVRPRPAARASRKERSYADGNRQ